MKSVFISCLSYGYCKLHFKVKSVPCFCSWKLHKKIILSNKKNILNTKLDSKWSTVNNPFKVFICILKSNSFNFVREYFGQYYKHVIAQCLLLRERVRDPGLDVNKLKGLNIERFFKDMSDRSVYWTFMVCHLCAPEKSTDANSQCTQFRCPYYNLASNICKAHALVFWYVTNAFVKCYTKMGITRPLLCVARSSTKKLVAPKRQTSNNVRRQLKQPPMMCAFKVCLTNPLIDLNINFECSMWQERIWFDFAHCI